MVVKKTAGSHIIDGLIHFVIILLIVITLYPFLYIVFASLSKSSKLEAYTGLLWRPLGFSTAAYAEVAKNQNIWTGYANTLFLVVVGTTLNILLTGIGAYVLSRKSFYLRKPITLMIVFTMFFGGGMIPTYMLVKSLGLLNSLWSCILPGLISTWNFMIMRTYFAGIPDSLEESAKLDGANDLIIFLRIFVPLSGPVVAVMALFFGVGHWNEWFNALIYITTRTKFPLQLILREILLANNTDSMMGGVVVDRDRQEISETIQYATIIVSTVPILFIYPFVQKYFVKGVMIGAIKG